MLLEKLVDRLADCLFRSRETGALRVGRIAQKGDDSLSSKLRESLQVDRVAENGRVVDLEVSGVDHDTHRRVNGESSRVDDAVVGLDKLHSEAAERNGRTERDHLSLGGLHHSPLLELVLYDAHREPCGEHRDIDLLKDVRQRADVVLMSVCDDKTLDFIDVILEISSVRDHQVDSEHVVLGKGQSAVYYNNTVFVFEGSYIHTDLLKASEGDDLEAGRSLFLIHIFLQVISSELLLFFAVLSL